LPNDRPILLLLHVFTVRKSRKHRREAKLYLSLPGNGIMSTKLVHFSELSEDSKTSRDIDTVMDISRKKWKVAFPMKGVEAMLFNWGFPIGRDADGVLPFRF
jgi:hypothetical protein